MKKTLLSILFVTGISMHIYGQQTLQLPGYADESYTCDIIQEDTDKMCIIDLFHDAKLYVMALSANKPLLHLCLLSVGTYEKSGNTIIFTDNGSLLQMKAEFIGKDKLNFQTAYSFMLENMFDLHVGDRFLAIPYEIPDPKYAAGLRSTPSVYVPKMKVRAGNYTAAGEWLSLSLNEDGTFSYFAVLYSHLLLKGTWEQRENKIILHDTHFNYDFTMLVRGSRLQSAFLIGDANPEGSIFTRE